MLVSHYIIPELSIVYYQAYAEKVVMTILVQITALDGLAWDWVSEKIYWTDNCQDDIEVYDTVAGYRTVLFNTGLIEPHAIVLLVYC